jgi:hypothetical protein
LSRDRSRGRPASVQAPRHDAQAGSRTNGHCSASSPTAVRSAKEARERPARPADGRCTSPRRRRRAAVAGLLLLVKRQA